MILRVLRNNHKMGVRDALRALIAHFFALLLPAFLADFFFPPFFEALDFLAFLAGAAAAGAPALAAALGALFLITFFLMDPLLFDLEDLALLVFAGFVLIE